MKHLLLSLALLALAIPSAIGAPISAREAAQMIGSQVTVVATVGEVKHFRSGRVLVNLDGAYPDEDLTLDIAPANAGLFPDVDSWYGAEVQVTGVVFEYKGRPEIELADPGQISVR